MTTVAQMIEWLQTLPQEATIQCLREVVKPACSYAVYDQVDLGSCKVYDYRGDVSSPYADHVIVTINAD